MDVGKVINDNVGLLAGMVNDVGFYITYDGAVVLLPYNPPELNVRVGGHNQQMEIITLGDIVIPKKKRLAEISWECFFPAQSWLTGTKTRDAFLPPSFYLKFLEKIRDDCKPCRLTITNIGYDSQVVIESFDYHHQAGDHEDVYYKIKFKEYRPYAVSEVNVSQANEQIKKITPVGTQAINAKVTPTPKSITIGANVILNGTVHYDSYGSKPGKTFTNYKGKVNLINKKGTHIYHVTTPSGGWLGWVKKESVVLV